MPLYPILAVNFVGTLGFSVVLPFLVFLVTRWGGNALVYGVVVATYSVFQLIGAPILGRWSDVQGRRRILLLSQAGTLLSWLVFLLAFALPATPLFEVSSGPLGAFTLTLPLVVVFLARAMDGLTGGNISVATAYLADISRDEDRSANFGKLAVSANLGFILGPAIAGLLGATRYGEVVPVLAATAISLVATLMIVFGLPESRLCVMDHDPDEAGLRRVFGAEHKPCYEMKGTTPLTTSQIMKIPGVPLLLTIYFLVFLGFNFFYVSFPMHAVAGLAWSVADTGMFFAALSALMAFVQGPVLGFASRKFGDGALVRLGGVILTLGFLFFVSSGRGPIYVGAALMALGNGLMWPSVVAVLSRRAGPSYQGAVQGLAGSLGAAASIVGLLAGGILYDSIGPRVFVFSAGMILIVCLMTAGLHRSGDSPAAGQARMPSSA